MVCVFELNDFMNQCWKAFFGLRVLFWNCIVFGFGFPLTAAQKNFISHMPFELSPSLSLNLVQFLLLPHSHFYSWYVYDVEMCSRFCWFHSCPYIIAIEVGSCICKCMYKLPPPLPPFSLSHTSSFQLSSWRASFSRLVNDGKWKQIDRSQHSTICFMIPCSLFLYFHMNFNARARSLFLTLSFTIECVSFIEGNHCCYYW